MHGMGILRTTIAIEHPARRGLRAALADVIVDCESAFTCAPRPVLEWLGIVPERVLDFVTADGREIVREVGFANVYFDGIASPDLVVFAERGDLTLLGAHALRGLNLRVDAIGWRLVPAGAVPQQSAGQAPHPCSADVTNFLEDLGVGPA